MIKDRKVYDHSETFIVKVLGPIFSWIGFGLATKRRKVY